MSASTNNEEPFKKPTGTNSPIRVRGELMETDLTPEDKQHIQEKLKKRLSTGAVAGQIMISNNAAAPKSPKLVARRAHISGSLEDLITPLPIKNSPLARTTSLGYADDKGTGPVTPRQSLRGDNPESLSRASTREIKEREKEEERKRKEEMKREEEKKKKKERKRKKDEEKERERKRKEDEEREKRT